MSVSVPMGLVVTLLLALSVPNGFPYRKGHDLRNLHPLVRIDFLGGLLSTAATVLLLFALQQGGVDHAWSDAVIVVSMVVSAVLWISFAAWEVCIERFELPIDALIPAQLLKRRLFPKLVL